ncbi:hypothetical protein BC941DRAFT_476542 [Chlamydoabsidia padenii]|nr:hypothetical protein BC941DRAFT_476542 [Chlamydoabsidia padenii]
MVLLAGIPSIVSRYVLSLAVLTHLLFMRDMLIRPTNEELENFGTEHAGEMKKDYIFTVMYYLMAKAGVLSLHSSANEGPDGDLKLIGDDEHCLSDDGVFNIECGCYAKCIDFSGGKKPDIFSPAKTTTRSSSSTPSTTT